MPSPGSSPAPPTSANWPGPGRPGRLDLWQAQVLGRVLERAEVWVHSEGLSDHEIRSGLMVPVSDPTAAVSAALARRGPGARLCVLPQGPLTVATPNG